MADLAHAYTDKQIEKLQHEIEIVYKQAEIDIRHKMKDFEKRYRAKESIHKKEVKQGKMTQEQFDNWKKGQVFQRQQWNAKRASVINTMQNANATAVKMINGQTTNVFAVNANYASYLIEHDAGVNFGFGVYDSAAVVNLIKNNPQALPKWKINQAKDYVWSQKKVNRAVTQGIIQGESIYQIADRLTNKLVSSNKDKMLTFARTAMTGAQNSGRLTSMKAAKDLGIDLEKEWMATLDGHTRDSHADIDGERVSVDSKFSNGLDYPGDPGGAPAEVYNCRCTMVSDVKKYPAKYQRYDNIEGKPIENMTYKEWEKAKSKGRDKEQGRGHVDMTNKDNYTKSKLDWVIIDTGFSEVTAEEVLSSIRTFTGKGYDWVVEHPESDQYKNMYEGVEKYVNKAPKWNGGNIERGIRMSVVDAENIKVGQIISQQNKASSWTTDDKLARTAATNKLKSDEVGVVFHMDLKVGETINGAAVSHLANKPREQEVILSGKSKQIVTSVTEEWVTKKKRIFHVHVRERI